MTEAEKIFYFLCVGFEMCDSMERARSPAVRLWLEAGPLWLMLWRIGGILWLSFPSAPFFLLFPFEE